MHRNIFPFRRVDVIRGVEMTKVEDLANELLVELFDSLDDYQVYRTRNLSNLARIRCLRLSNPFVVDRCVLPLVSATSSPEHLARESLCVTAPETERRRCLPINNSLLALDMLRDNAADSS